MRIKGLVPAVFTPMKENGDINPEKIQDIMKYLGSKNVEAIYVAGSTGEGPLLTLEERKIIVKESHLS